MADASSESRTCPPGGFDLISPECYRHGFPHELFTTLRREAPVSWHVFLAGTIETQDEGFWVLAKHDDLQAANRDAELFCALDGPTLAAVPEMRGQMLVSMDGREHLRQRRLISAGFTPRMVGRLEEQARCWSASIVDRALERGTCSFVTDVAYQLPMHMIADIVGIPVEDRPWLFDLMTDFLGAGDPERALSRPQQLAIQAQMFQYAQELGTRKRDAPCSPELRRRLVEMVRAGRSPAELTEQFQPPPPSGAESERNDP